MGALKPREGPGELEAAREARRVIVRIPVDERAERVVFTVDDQEAKELATRLADATSCDDQSTEIDGAECHRLGVNGTDC